MLEDSSANAVLKGEGAAELFLQSHIAYLVNLDIITNLRAILLGSLRFQSALSCLLMPKRQALSWL